VPPIHTSMRPFEPGTTGWSASDLDDPEIEELWLQGRYEIVDGVPTTMAPAYCTGGEASSNLLYFCQKYVREHKLGGSFAIEADIIIDESRVAVADFVYMSDADKRRQFKAFKLTGRPDPDRTRILIPPTLIVESISPGHERHAQVTKLQWYAEFSVPNYWILDGFKKTLDCYVLESSAYRIDVGGRGKQIVRPSLFPSLAISLAQIWNK
jgi:Uma2 family endonuclease